MKLLERTRCLEFLWTLFYCTGKGQYAILACQSFCLRDFKYKLLFEGDSWIHLLRVIYEIMVILWNIITINLHFNSFLFVHVLKCYIFLWSKSSFFFSIISQVFNDPSIILLCWFDGQTFIIIIIVELLLFFYFKNVLLTVFY